MTLRTPRRRISPQTRRRCRAIKGFFRRALGTASQPDIQITSSIAVNVTDTKHKTPEGFRQGNQRYQDCASELSERDLQTPCETVRNETRQKEMSGTQLNGVETQILYKTPETHYKKSDDSESGKAKIDSNIQLNQDINDHYGGQYTEKKNKKGNVKNKQKSCNIDPYFQRHKTKSAYETFISEFSGTSIHTLSEFKEMAYPDSSDTIYEEQKGTRSKKRKEFHKDQTHMEHKKASDYIIHEERAKNKKHKSSPIEIDKKFIAEIIKRQYKPVKIGRRISDLSQFSTPQCRDKELRFIVDGNFQQPPITHDDNTQYNGRRNRSYGNYHSDIESVCDIKNHNLKINNRRTKQRRKLISNYNDSDIYDMVPVKEKSSPKSRRKFFEDNMACDSLYKEVPPSPRTHRPRLNLKAQCYTGCEEEVDYYQTNLRDSPRRPQGCEIDCELNYATHPNRKPSPKRFMQEHNIDNSMDYIPQPRRVLKQRSMHQNEDYDDVGYVTRPYRRASPKMPVQQQEQYEVDYVMRPSRSSSPKRLIQPNVNKVDVDYISRPCRRSSPKKTIQQHDNPDGIVYMTQPNMRVSPQRPPHVNEEILDYNGFASRTPRLVKQQECQDVVDHNKHEINQNVHSEGIYVPRNKQQTDIPNEMVCSFQCSTIDPDDNAVANKTQETVISVDKTDKALSEIKDILQNFLQEIKKESPQSDKSDISAKMTEHSTNMNPNICCGEPNSVNSLNDYTSFQCPLTPSPYIPNFGNNACCYPILPICPMNCMQGGFPAPSSSFTCAHCVNKPSETHKNNRNISTNQSANDTNKNDTTELIKEIYKFVSQSPTFCRRTSNSNEKLNSPRKDTLDPQLTSRSAGGSTAVCRHNAKVGTPRTKCVSKSCEAITKKISEAYISETNQSYSETILEKVSLEATVTESTTDSESSSETEEEKKKSRFARVFESFRIFKKKKKDVIEELSESEEESEKKLKSAPPFRQHLTNYMMHDQEYFIPPPIPPYYRPDYPQNYGAPYNHGFPPEYSIPASAQNKYQNSRMPPSPPLHEAGHPYSRYTGPTAPPMSSTYEAYNHMPQLPICLKEIEVKSIGCQSERKLSFFGKIGKKNQNPPEAVRFEQIQKSCSTQTAQNAQKRPGMFNWSSNVQRKPMNPNDPLNFSFKTKRMLENGDSKMKKAMIKKMFHKKNPFSPNNLIIRTLLGKDKSSFGDPPSVYRPRMFL